MNLRMLTYDAQDRTGSIWCVVWSTALRLNLSADVAREMADTAQVSAALIYETVSKS